ncbi:RimJ/RimL family protein N-acetyltransferase [Arthrobacter sp. PvP102]|uniref:GNAT family N-acetyltransferase n=1 Tax=unclassified Arthrobacter TaxID=235627 RepID=UPI001AE98925|nr:MULTISPECIES: GNAT family N-acetyltransferase [unclassified Arthrobacter]MBP1231364.1 RimJ/RimL family protein N-acetyltransferase [Arthrobacter sp. PvP103]MBP1236499.1 RimJ/RimL family protein N-acetyltransferase [Arthrobacter sp. PvP102]
MSPSSQSSLAGCVELLDVTEEILAKLLDVALTDAAADDVTPTLGATPGWNAERIGWFLNYHRAAAAGLDGPAAQKSWAISCDGRLAGSIRLKRAGTAASAVTALETGLWLGRSFRGRGIGREALKLVCTVAAATGASVLQAETTAGNSAARALLRSAGAELAGDGVTTPLTARISLH